MAGTLHPKICVLGLDCAAPEIVFGDQRLKNLRRLMDAGNWGRLESVIPPITIPAWMCMSTSRDPGTLGIYGFRNRSDWSYDALSTVNSKSFTDLAIWDQVAREGKRAHVIGVPPSYPPTTIAGISHPVLLGDEASFAGVSDNPVQHAVADYTHIFGPSLINDLRAGFNRFRVDYTLGGTTPAENLGVELGVVVVADLLPARRVDPAGNHLLGLGEEACQEYFFSHSA